MGATIFTATNRWDSFWIRINQALYFSSTLTRASRTVPALKPSNRSSAIRHPLHLRHLYAAVGCSGNCNPLDAPALRKTHFSFSVRLQS